MITIRIVHPSQSTMYDFLCPRCEEIADINYLHELGEQAYLQWTLEQDMERKEEEQMY